MIVVTRRRTRLWDGLAASLHAELHAEDIGRILVNHVFPLEFLVSLELAQLRTFTIPTISRLLHRTGQYEREGRKRLDDTRAILTEIHRPGLDSGPSREMVDHLNRMHGLYPISNDDFLYTLSTFVFDPMIFIERWGHRPLTIHEQEGLFFLYRKLADAMHIRDVPESRFAFWNWRRSYEQRAQGYASENEAVARGMLRSLAGMIPGGSEAAFESFAVACLDDPAVQAALGLRTPSRRFLRAFRAVMLARRMVAGYLNPFERSAFWDSAFFKSYRTYPRGYERMSLGPDGVLAILKKRANGAGPPSQSLSASH